MEELFVGILMILMLSIVCLMIWILWKKLKQLDNKIYLPLPMEFQTHPDILRVTKYEDLENLMNKKIHVLLFIMHNQCKFCFDLYDYIIMKLNEKPYNKENLIICMSEYTDEITTVLYKKMKKLIRRFPAICIFKKTNEDKINASFKYGDQTYIREGLSNFIYSNV